MDPSVSFITRINIKFISGELNIDPNDVESLLVSCILDNTISGRIDQVVLTKEITWTIFALHNGKKAVLIKIFDRKAVFIKKVSLVTYLFIYYEIFLGDRSAWVRQRKRNRNFTISRSWQVEHSIEQSPKTCHQ